MQPIFEVLRRFNKAGSGGASAEAADGDWLRAVAREEIGVLRQCNFRAPDMIH